MSMRNEVQLIGHLGKDIETLQTDSQKTVAKTTMATKESYKNSKGERVEQTDWHQLVMFGGVADLASKYIGKGSFVKVVGQLKTRSYTAKDGSTKWTTEIIVSDILFLDQKRT
jgi:single-strand DNA-binding protein